MSGILMASGISSIVFVIGIVMCTLSKPLSEWNNSGQIIVAVSGVLSLGLFFGSMMNVHESTYTYIEPITITKTADGFTIVSYNNPELKTLISDKANIYICDNTNLIVEIKKGLNVWDKSVSETATVQKHKCE